MRTEKTLDSPSSTAIRCEDTADVILVTTRAVHDVAGVAVLAAARAVGRCPVHPVRRRRFGAGNSAVAGEAHGDATEVVASATGAVQVATVTPFAGTQPVAVVQAAGAVGAVHRVAGAGALVADSSGAVISRVATFPRLRVATLVGCAETRSVAVRGAAELVRGSDGLDDYVFPLISRKPGM